MCAGSSGAKGQWPRPNNSARSHHHTKNWNETQIAEDPARWPKDLPQSIQFYDGASVEGARPSTLTPTCGDGGGAECSAGARKTSTVAQRRQDVCASDSCALHSRLSCLRSCCGRRVSPSTGISVHRKPQVRQAHMRCTAL